MPLMIRTPANGHCNEDFHRVDDDSPHLAYGTQSLKGAVGSEVELEWWAGFHVLEHQGTVLASQLCVPGPGAGERLGKLEDLAEHQVRVCQEDSGQEKRTDDHDQASNVQIQTNQSQIADHCDHNCECVHKFNQAVTPNLVHEPDQELHATIHFESVPRLT